MINWDLLFAIIFYSLIILIFFWKRNKFDVQNKIFVMYKTKLGLKLMDKLAKKFPKLLNFLGIMGIILGYLGMAFIFIILIKETFKFLTIDGAVPPLAPVLPGIAIPGAPTLSFWHWIIAIFIVALVHEMAHGIMARVHKIQVKSSGVFFLGPIFGAFVEPNEKEMEKVSIKKQLSILAAGPFSNIIFGFIFLLIVTFGLAPAMGNMLEFKSITINQILEGYPMEKTNIEVPFKIISVDNHKIDDESDFIELVSALKPGTEMTLETDKGSYSIVTVADPNNSTKGFIGISGFEIEQQIKPEVIAKYGLFWPNALQWISLLTLWLFLINIGVGLFNLLPLGPVDGGKMFYLTNLIIFKDKIKAQKIFGFISFLLLVIILINLYPYISKLIIFLLKPVGMFIS